MSSIDAKIEELIRAAIYHGRHFSPTRDDAVVRNSVRYIHDMVQKAAAESNATDYLVEWRDKSNPFVTHYVPLRGYGAELICRVLEEGGYTYKLKEKEK